MNARAAALLLGVLLPVPVTAQTDRWLATVVSAPATGGGRWRTTLQAHNASAAPSRLELVFHPAGEPARADHPRAALALAAGQTIGVDDLLRERFGVSDGSGSLDVLHAEGDPPALAFEVRRESGGGGSVGLAVPLLSAADALQSGERAVLMTPASSGQRFNIGARALGAPVALAITVVDAGGQVRGTGARRIAAGVQLQESAAGFASSAVAPGDVLIFDVLAGALFLYGTPVDELSGDGSYQAASRLAPSSELVSDFTPPVGRVGDAPGGPGVMRLMTATSADGLAFQRTGQVITDQGDVPDVAVDSRGWLYLTYIGWTVGAERNKVVVAISRDKGRSFVFKKAVLTGFEGMADPVDPDLQILEDGRFRLYLTSAEGGDFTRARTYYAEGTDGIHYAKKGLAFVPPAGVALDPSTARIGATWHLFSGGQPGSNRHATSPDGTTYLFDREMTFLRDGVGQLMANGTAVPGGTRFYTFDSIPSAPGRQPGIGSVFTADGVSWTVEPGQRLAPDPASPLESSGVKDPAVARLPDDSYLMVYVTRIP